MVVQPKSYISSADGEYKLGGYLLNDVTYTDSIISDNWLLSAKSTILNNNIIFNMVNKLNSVAFSINEKVLNFLLDNYKKYNLLIDPDYIHPLTLKTKLTKVDKTELESFNSKKELEQNILGLATIFREVPKFYLPIRLDYRGRIYCVTEYLNYQGSELAKALLLFSKGNKVLISDTLSINYLKVFGANCYGNSLNKKSFEDRIKWINENETNIINFDNGKLISKAENKLLFISFCFEYNSFLKFVRQNTTDSFITHLPIQFDASCNGFQHLTLLIKDLTLYKELNLSESKWSDMPKDFYSFVALKIKEYFIKESINNNLDNDTKESYKKLSALNIHRSLIKKSIMTIPYNASAYSIVQYIKEDFNKIYLRRSAPDYKSPADFDSDIQNDTANYIFKGDPNIKFKEIDFQSLRKALNIVLFNDYPKLKSLLNYLKEIAKISNVLKVQIPWVLPSGLLVQQQYYSTKTIKVKPFIYSKDLLNLKIIDKKQFNSRKQIRAFMPNLIHSLDAASLALLINEFFKENKQQNFYSIHDCFAVTCNNIPIIIEYLKAAYCIIYSKENYLSELDAGFLNNIKKYFGSSCYDPETKIITIENPDKIIKLKYPDVRELISNDFLDFTASSYLIH